MIHWYPVVVVWASAAVSIITVAYTESGILLHFFACVGVFYTSVVAFNVLRHIVEKLRRS